MSSPVIIARTVLEKFLLRNRNFAVWTLTVGFKRLRVKGERTAMGEGEGCF
jgi:hypothetical protein